MKEIIVASTNQGKIREIRAMLSQIGIEVKSIQDIFHDVRFTWMKDKVSKRITVPVQWHED